MVRTVVLLLAAGVQVYGAWGAKELSQSDRPKTGWLSRFSGTPDIVVDANRSVMRAIRRCDRIVGRGGYCVVGIRPGRLSGPVVIRRSRTKLTGVGSGAIRAFGEGTMFRVASGVRHVALEHLNLRGKDVGDGSIYAIVVEGKKIDGVVIRRNRIHHFSTGNGNAHAIAVYGTGNGNGEAIRNVLIRGNTIHDMRTGSSESIALNGNVFHWEVSRNDLYDLNNIAIDLIGGEGTAPTRQGREGRILPGRSDAARYGFVEENYVENVHTEDNPAYGNEESWAAAIYIDGGHHILVRDNIVEDAAWGYEVGAENCVSTRQITLRGNRARGSTFGDLLLGGYRRGGFREDTTIGCDPRQSRDRDEGHGYVEYVSVYDNDFRSRHVKEKRILPQFRVTHTIIEEKGVRAVNDEGDGSATGDQNAIRTHR